MVARRWVVEEAERGKDDVVGTCGTQRKMMQMYSDRNESSYKYSQQRKNPDHDVQRGSVVRAASFWSYGEIPAPSS